MVHINNTYKNQPEKMKPQMSMEWQNQLREADYSLIKECFLNI